MKRIISLIMTVVMLLSAMLFVVPASASKEDSTASAENIDYVDALYFEKAPTIDGVVSEEEWGPSSFTVDATDCATQDDTEPYNRCIYINGSHASLVDLASWTDEFWLRWDENYLYIAAKVKDPDGHQLKHGSGDTWNGDALQVKIDPEGPNAVIGGEEFEVNENYTLPWSSQNVPCFLFGYCQIAGGFSEAWECTSNKGMTSFSRNAMGTAPCIVAPAGSNYSSDTQNGVTTYEVGIPWAYLLNGENDESGAQLHSLTYTEYKIGRTNSNRGGGIGREFGMSILNLDDGMNPDAEWDAWMAWGSGIATAHQVECAASATGSNSVMLSKEKVTQGDYTKQDATSLLDASFSTANWDKTGVFYDYLDYDFDAENPKAKQVKYEDLTVLTYDGDPDSDRSIWGSDMFQGRIADVGGSHGNVLDYSWMKKGQEGNQTYVHTQDDAIDYKFPTSYTHEFEIQVTGTEITEDYVDSKMYYWFGGPGGISFQCEYNFNDSMFSIHDSAYHPSGEDYVATESYNLKKNNWYRWRFQYDDESCTCRLWVDDLSDPSDDGDGWGRMIFNQRWRYFNCAGTTQVYLPFQFRNTQVQFDNIKIYNFGSITDVEEAYESSDTQGTGTGTTTTTQTGGGEVAIDTSKVYKQDGNWHVPVFAKSEYATATQLTFSLKYDPAKSEFVGIEGLAEGTYTVNETVKGTVDVIIKDFAAIKALKAGDKYFEFILKALDNNASAADLGLKLSDSYVYTVTTGDAMTFIVIGGVFALAAATAVLVVRRKKEEE